MNMPMGTVMSSLSRAREAFRGAVDVTLKQHGIPRTHHPAGARHVRRHRRNPSSKPDNLGLNGRSAAIPAAQPSQSLSMERKQAR